MKKNWIVHHLEFYPEKTFISNFEGNSVSHPDPCSDFAGLNGLNFGLNPNYFYSDAINHSIILRMKFIAKKKNFHTAIVDI